MTDEAMSMPPSPQGDNDDAGKATKKKKTVYLIRHAESEENRRLGSLKNAFGSMRQWTLPAMSDLVATAELVNLPAQVDSDVSAIGQAQIQSMADTLQRDNFVQACGIQLVVHSPLLRARETCFGMLQCRTGSAATATNDAQDANSDSNNKDYALHAAVQRVEELQLLTEKTPMEWIPGQYMKEQFRARIAAFEDWLHEQPETVVAVVGHSQYFRAMLNLPYKFDNCDVWKVQFDYDSQSRGVPNVDTTTTTTTTTTSNTTQQGTTSSSGSGSVDTTNTTIKSSFFSNWMPSIMKRGNDDDDNDDSTPAPALPRNNVGEPSDNSSSLLLLPPQWSSLELLYKCSIVSSKNEDDDVVVAPES
jgi:broad specificity phosphatase PhoE